MNTISDHTTDDEDHVVTRTDFKAWASIHGMHTIPSGNGTIHKMEPGKIVQLDGKYDSWIPLEDEPLLPQLKRTTLTKREAKRREMERQKLIKLYMTSPLYRARVENNPDYWDTYDFSGLL